MAGVLEGCHKIGSSAEPSRRLAQMITLPVELSTVATIKTRDATWLERVLHSHFAVKRQRGEWFRLTEGDIELIRSMREVNRPSDLPSIILSRLPDDLLAAFIESPEGTHFTASELAIVTRAAVIRGRSVGAWIKQTELAARLRCIRRHKKPPDNLAAIANQKVLNSARAVLARIRLPP